MDNAGNTILHLGVSMKDHGLSSLLLLKGADPNAMNKGGITPTVLAKRMKFTRLLSALKKHGGIVPPEEDHSGAAGNGRRKSTRKETEVMKRRLAMEHAAAALEVHLGGVDSPSEVRQLDTALAVEGVTKPSQVKFPTYTLPFYDAAYLGLAVEQIPILPIHYLTTADAFGSTPLMKAAMRGHVGVVAALLKRHVALNRPDNYGNTALVWAAFGGNLAVVQLLLDQAGLLIEGYATAEGEEELGHGMTPLGAASIAGHAPVVSLLLEHGAQMDKGSGPSRDRTPLMYAAWMRHEDVVRALVTHGARVDSDTDHWLKKGIIYLKRASLDYNVWTGCPGTFTKTILAGTTLPSPSSTIKTPPMSLKDKMHYFSAEENQAITTLEGIMRGDAHIKESSGSLAKSSASLFSLAENEDAASRGDLTMSSGPMVSRQRTRGKQRGRYRHGMNLDKLIGQNPEVVAELTEQVPERGTELDILWVQVFQLVVQLLIAANQNKKPHYIIISAKAIHQAGEIVRAIESAEKSNPIHKASSPFSPTTLFPILHTTPETNLFASSKVRIRLRELCKLVNGELPKQLMLTTRIAIGVWPPQHAMSDMIKAATDLARTCRELTDIANLTGVFGVLDRILDVQFTAFETEDDSMSPATADPATDTALKVAVPASLTYEEYKRQNDLKVLEEISKQSNQTRQAALTVAQSPSGEQTELQQQAEQQQREKLSDLAFFAKLDELLRAFVDTMKEIKLAFQNHLKHQYITLTSTAAHRAEVIIDEVRGYDLLTDFPEELTFDADDGAVLRGKGVNLGVDSYPVTVADFWYATLNEVRLAARNVTMKGKLASGYMPPPNATEDMVRSTIPCLLAVKKLVVISKESAHKIRRTSHDKVTKQEKWERAVAQNEHVKHLFVLWEQQVLLPQQEIEDEISTPSTASAATPSAEVAAQVQEMELLRDDLEGLVLESSGNSKLVVRGGRLSKLVEWMTSHIHYDPEFTANLLLTHHSFTTTSELLDLLFRRYTLTAPPALSRNQYDTFLKRKIFPVKQRVCTVLKTWLDMLFEDDFMYGDHVGIFKLRDFCSENVVKDSELWGRELMDLVELKLNKVANPSAAPPQLPTVGPPPKLPRLSPDTDILTILNSSLLYHDLDPLELARQLAILDQRHFAKIKPHECLDQIWGEKRRKEMGLSRTADVGITTGLGEMIRHTNVVTIWIANCIIQNDDLKARRDAIKYFAQMAVHCHELNNYNGITALNAAMSTAAINRLHKTWDAFREKYPKLDEAYQEAAATVSPKGQYANYRKVLKELAPPAVPFLGVSLTDLTFTELGNPDFLPDTSLINFDKRRKVYQVLTQSIQKYQAVPYPLVVVPGINAFLTGLGSLTLMNDDELYETSLRVEPKEEELSDEENDDGP
ncbi:hypothetical protein HKX48_004007 [Thoreauomyces humboldtii]|nr:hypothetical protein HKX48_004007 [Thoreauomyces humboldtii]